MVDYLELERDNVVVSLEYTDEGRCGEYNPADPEDYPHLRFYVFLDNDAVEDVSHCTLLNADTLTVDQAHQVLNLIMNEVYDKVRAGESVKKIGEQLSWLRVDTGGVTL
jgi:hypothetical protein